MLLSDSRVRTELATSQSTAPTDVQPERSEPLLRNLLHGAFGNDPDADHPAACKAVGRYSY